MSTQFRALLGSLTRHRGVVGCMVVDEVAGVIVDSDLHYGVRGDVVAALAASLYRKARFSSHAAGLGAVAFLDLGAERGHICIVGRGDLILIVIAEARVNLGLLRTAMLKATESLS